MPSGKLITVEQALAKAEPALRRAFSRMVASMQGSMSLDEIVALLEQGRFEQAFSELIGGAVQFSGAYNAEFISAAEAVAAQIGEAINNITISFDVTNEAAVRAMRENRLRLISGFTQSQRNATSEALISGIARGANPIEQARAFRDSIGLTPTQVRAVNNYRNALEAGGRDSLSRQLRDRRFDPSVIRAAQEGDVLSAKQIERMTNRYREKMLAHRAKTIARTEALRSVHEGQQNMFNQAIREGTLAEDNLIQEWNTALDERVRGSHASMHNQQRFYGQPFTSGRGYETLHPGAFGVASEDINCRCTVGIRILEYSAIQSVEFA